MCKVGWQTSEGQISRAGVYALCHISILTFPPVGFFLAPNSVPLRSSRLVQLTLWGIAATSADYLTEGW